MTKKIKITDIQKIIGKKKIDTGLVLGSGLGKAIPLKKKVEFEYNEIKGFNLPSVTGHSGKLLIGTIHNRMVVVLSGRTHFYENGKADTMRNPIKLLKDLGVEKLIVTNASGSRWGLAPSCRSVPSAKEGYCLLYTSDAADE